MQIIADLHIHSRFSRACSKAITLESIAKTCEQKGIDLVATGDFTHPTWFSEIKSKLMEVAPGVYQLKDKSSPTKFLLATELSCIYSQGGKTRRLHICVWAPSISVVEKFNAVLGKVGKLQSDGRPILGMSAKRLLEISLSVDENILNIPAHIWTPWFAMFGSKSGFDSIEECYEELSPNIYAVETGLSSDPAMNWRVKNLDKVTLVSNSDAHSVNNIGREANIFDLIEVSYPQIFSLLKNHETKKFIKTLEFFPEEGMYHFDGHRSCGVSLKPAQSKKYKNICPKCGKPLVIGVLNRVEELASRPENFLDPARVPYQSVIPLKEILANFFATGDESKRVNEEYTRLISQGKSEFNILLKLAKKELEAFMPEQLAEGIIRVREGRVELIPGFDGQYGKVKIFAEEEKIKSRKQAQLF
ncbi:MAG: endonuclease Q family protein [Candidatus Komeilibacteria bacterium]|nr:endonuclease Q family protein [Candidatus Komeilibacteria bacterium]